CTSLLEGIHSEGSWSPFSLLLEGVANHSWEEVTSLAKSARSSVVQSAAPVFHASLSGTKWSTLMSAGSSWTHSSSKALHQLPAVGWQLSSVTTSCPSRSRTTWRAVQGLSTTFQWGKRLRS